LKRDWTVYLVQHTHTDIGYTRPQTEILSEHLRYIDYAIDYCDQTKDYPDDSKFRWTCESAWAVSEFVRQRPDKDVERLKDCIRRGQMEVTAMYFNMAEIVDENSLRYFVLPLKQLKDRGIPFSVAMQNDVNGIAWSLCDIFPDIDVKYLWMGEHTHKALEPFDMPTVFRWESPSGKSMYAYRAEHYMFGNFWGIERADFDMFADKLFKYLCELEAKGYPFNEIAVQYSGTFTDNAPPSPKECEFIDKWNCFADGRPRLRSSLAHDFMDKVTGSYSADIKSYRTAYPDWWTDGFASASLETAQARNCQADMLSNQGLLSMAVLSSEKLPSFTGGEIADIHNNLLFYDEHTFGYSESVNDPLCLQSQLQWMCKASYAWTAQKKAKMLYETSGGLLQSLVSRDTVPTITFFNPLVWERDALTEIYIDYDIIPENGSCAIVDEKGNELKAQVVSRRREGCFWRIAVPAVPSLGYRTYRILSAEVPGGGSKTAPEPSFKTAPEKNSASKWALENNWYRINIDKATGGVSSIYDKVAGKEMVDGKSEWTLGQLVHEIVEDRTPLQAKMIAGMSRISVTDVEMTASSEGRLFRSAVISAKEEGLAPEGLKMEIRLYEDQPLIELLYSIRPKANTNPQAYYIAFPFTGEKLAVDVQGGVMLPGENQLEGTSTEWNTIQNFVAARSDNYQILLSSKDAPIFQLGSLMAEGPFHYTKEYEHPHVFSWLMNNYWNTNFKASQEGELQFRYTLTTDSSNSDTKALRFGMSDRVQLYGRVLPRAEATSEVEALPMEKSLLSIPEDNITVISCTPSQTEGYVLLQVRETSGKKGAVLSFTRNGKNVAFDLVNIFEQTQQKKLKSLDLPPSGNVFVKLSSK